MLLGLAIIGIGCRDSKEPEMLGTVVIETPGPTATANTDKLIEQIIRGLEYERGVSILEFRFEDNRLGLDCYTHLPRERGIPNYFSGELTVTVYSEFGEESYSIKDPRRVYDRPYRLKDTEFYVVVRGGNNIYKVMVSSGNEILGSFDPRNFKEC